MAAPSVGRRSTPGKREAAALISQNRRWDMWNERTKSTCPATVFFFPRWAGQDYLLYFRVLLLPVRYDILLRRKQGIVPGI